MILLISLPFDWELLMAQFFLYFSPRKSYLVWITFPTLLIWFQILTLFSMGGGVGDQKAPQPVFPL